MGLGLFRLFRLRLLARVVGHVPARALELKAGARPLLLKLPAALRVARQGLVRDLLHHLHVRAALLTRVFVNRHPYRLLTLYRCLSVNVSRKLYGQTFRLQTPCNLRCAFLRSRLLHQFDAKHYRRRIEEPCLPSVRENGRDSTKTSFALRVGRRKFRAFSDLRVFDLKSYISST